MIRLHVTLNHAMGMASSFYSFIASITIMIASFFRILDFQAVKRVRTCTVGDPIGVPSMLP